MREIKFMAWDKMMSEMKMFPTNQCFFDYIGNDYGSQSTRFEIMQYTSLKDKKGKEIYEDDLIAMNVYEIEVDFPKTKMNILYEGVVRFYQPWNAFVLEVHHKSVWGGRRAKQGFPINLFSEYKHDIEVIGNIYENPELLTPLSEDSNEEVKT